MTSAAHRENASRCAGCPFVPDGIRHHHTHRGQVKPEEVVAGPKVVTRRSVSFVLPHLTGRVEQFEAAPDEEVAIEIRLERFGGYLSSVHVHGEEVDVVVLGMKQIFVVRTVVRFVIDAAHNFFCRLQLTVEY